MVRRRTRRGFWAFLVLLVGGGASFAIFVGKPAPAPELPVEVALPVVDVVLAAPAVRSLTVETQGTVRPLREIQLMSQVGGKVESVSPRFAQGGFFAANETLVKIEEIDYQFVIARVESQVAAAKQRVAEEEGRALQAQREWQDLGSDQANALFLRKPQLASARAALKASEADFAAAQLDIVRTAISAPFNGRISKKHVDIGQFVAPGTAIATVYDTDVAQVRLPLTGRQIALLNLPLHFDNATEDAVNGAQVRIRTRFANKEWEWQGRLVRTDASVDVDSRVVYAVAEIEKPFARDPDSDRPPLSPGLFVSATISGRQLPQVSQLPRSALHSDGTMMIVDREQRAQSRTVGLLQSDTDYVWVQGLDRDERVIVDESISIVPGMAVSVNTVDLANGSL